MFRHNRSLKIFTSALLSYALLILLCAPLSSAGTVKNSNQPASAEPAPPSQTTGRRDGELLVKFRTGVSQEDKDIVVTSHGTRRKRQLRGESGVEKLELLAGQDAETVALQLRLHPSVEFAEPNFLIRHDELRSDVVVARPSQPTGLGPLNPARPGAYLGESNPGAGLSYANSPTTSLPLQSIGTQPNDPRFSEQWALSNTGQSGGQFGSDIGVTSAWQTTTGSESTVIAVIDSGIDFTHPDLAINQWLNIAPGPDGDLNGWDYITDSGTIRDEQGHGTAIAGVIAAQGNNEVGVSGVMWRASLMSLRVLDNTGTGDIANAVEAIDYAVSHGAEVINISWGTTSESIALKNAIERAIRGGVLVVCSAGNNGQDVEQTPYYPASFNIRELISVASSDNFDQLASWSNWGPRRVTVAAPGINILTTQMGGGYWTVTGTSASAPLVSGIAGLVKTQRNWLSVAATRAAVVDGVRVVSGLAGKVSSGGIASASGALRSLRGPYEPPGGNGNGGGNGQGGHSPSPPNMGRNSGAHGRRVAPPAAVPGSNQGTPNLDAIRNRPSYVPEGLPAPIQSNLMCADCDPLGGGGGGGYYPPGDPNFSGPRTLPTNETGQPGVDLGSRNFNWSLPLLNLPGRSGLDLNLTLFYNSLVWTKDGSFIKYNADLGSPAPGFRLGLPILQQSFTNSQTGLNAYMMVTPSGGRVEMRQVGSSNIYESQDGSYTQLDVSNPGTPIVRTSDGTQLKFTPVTVNSEYRCIEIKDRNGNYISATYDTNNGHLQTLTDTLGRVITYDYDGNNNLEAIQQSWAGVTHNWATFSYGEALVAPNFGGGLLVNGPNNNSVTVLTRVNLHDGSYYTFEYNASFGQVKKINHYAPDAHLLAYTSYNVDSSTGQTDCPRFTERRDWAQNWNGDTEGEPVTSEEALNTYAVAGDGSWSRATLPDDTPGDANDNIVQKEYFATSGWQKGLTTRTEIFLAGSPAMLKKWTTTDWTQDDLNLTYQKNPRPTEINIYDEAANRRRTTIEYHSSFGLPWRVTEYAGDAVTVIRRTNSDYKMDAAYIDRRIIGLVSQKQVFDAAGTLYSRVVFGYDWPGELFVDTPAAATQHDRTNYGPGFVTGRGNLQHIIRVDAGDPDNSAKWQETKFRFNVTGSMLMARDHDWHENSLAYGDSFSDGVNRNTFAYPTTSTDAGGYQATTKYKYETGAVMETRRPSSGTTGQGNVTYETHVMIYDGVGRLEKVTNQNNGLYTRFEQAANPADMSHVKTYRNLKPGASEDYSVEVYDGHGRVRKTARFMPEKTDRYSAQMIHYNSLGQVVKQSKPTETLGVWTPAGDDAGGWVYTDQAYDWQGRPTVTTNPDGWTSELSYTGCGCAGGEVVTARDEAGRRRKLYNDTLGRLWKVEELNWDQTVYSTTTYTYNVGDQLTQISQQGQVRTLDYDGHGRLWKRTTPEQGPTEYSYNRDDTVSWTKDARGVKTNFAHTARHLLLSISYDLSGVLAGQNVAATPGASFEYNAAGNRWRMTDGFGTVTYHYDSLSRMDWEERVFTGVGTYRLTYGYDNAGLASVTNPWGSQVTYAHDHTGTVTGVTGAGPVSAASYASGIQYRAFGGLKAMTYGNSKQLSVQYDTRMRPVQWDVAGVLGSEYRYDYFHEHTGRVTFARNLYDVRLNPSPPDPSTLDRSYEYDEAGRLSWTYTGAEASAHAINGQWGVQNGPYAQANFYDQLGNITQRLGWGAANASFTASYTNNLRNGYTYDLAGNLANDLAQNFTYDATGQQATAGYSGYALAQGYDGDSLRVKKTENGVTSHALRSTVLGGQVVAETGYTGGGERLLWRGYVHLGRQLLAVQDAVVRWVHEDPITKTKRMTDTAGAVTSTLVFDPWGGDVGGVWSQNVSQQRRRFTTYQRDGNESDEAMMRRYNRWHARFDQPDPYDGSYDATNPQSFNRYAYVNNDPVNFVDPSGLDHNIDHWVPGPGDTPVITNTSAPYWSWLSGGRSGGVRGVRPPYVVEPRDRGADPQTPPQNPRQEPRDPDTNAVNAALSACSTGASIGQYSTVNPAGTAWRGGVNGQWSRMGWGGNGSTGARSAAIGRASSLGLLSRATGTVGAGFSFYQSGQAFRQGNYDQGARGIWDTGFGLAGAFGGPWGAAASGGWFGMSALLDSHPDLARACRCDAQCRRK